MWIYRCHFWQGTAWGKEKHTGFLYALGCTQNIFQMDWVVSAPSELNPVHPAAPWVQLCCSTRRAPSQAQTHEPQPWSSASVSQCLGTARGTELPCYYQEEEKLHKMFSILKVFHFLVSKGQHKLQQLSVFGNSSEGMGQIKYPPLPGETCCNSASCLDDSVLLILFGRRCLFKLWPDF